MPKGFGFVNRAAAEVAAKGGGSSLWAGKLIFKLPADGDTAVVRFIETDDEFVHSAWHHEVPVEGRQWGDQVPCIAQDEDGNRTDDDCPGCDADLPMKFKGYILLIWFDAPVYKTDDKGKVVKDNTGDPVILDTKDQVAIWSSGPRLFENLGEIHESYNGLGSRPFSVKRKGMKTKTEYIIMPKDIDGGPKKMTAAEKKLAEGHEIELVKFIQPPSFDQFKSRLEGGSFIAQAAGNDNGDGGDSATEASGRVNPFKRK